MVPEVRKMVPTGVTGCKGHEGLLRVPFLDPGTATLMSHVLTCRCARELPHFSATAERGAPTQLRFQEQIREQFLLLGQRLRVSSGRPPLASSTRTSGLPAVLPRPTHAWHPTHRSAGKMCDLPPGSQRACHANADVPELLSCHLAAPSPTSWAHRGTLGVFHVDPCCALGCRETLEQSRSVPRASPLHLVPTVSKASAHSSFLSQG